MSDINTSCSTLEQILNEGNVLLDGQQAYLRAKCGGIGKPAMLELYADGNCKSLIREIPFDENVTKVDYKVNQGKLHFSMTKRDDNGITFCAYSDEATKEWIQYCILLLTIPNYPRPVAEPPKKMFITKELITQHSDPQRFGADRVWPVYILHEGIGSVLKLTGLHILALYYHECNYQLKLYDLTGECVLVWDGNKIRRCGYIKSLVFVEAGRRCAGGPGLLWMQHPIPFSTELCECLYKFLKLNLKINIAPSCCTSADSTEAAKHLLASTTVQSSHERSSSLFNDSQPQNPNKGYYRQIDSSSDSQASNSSHTYRPAMSSEKGNDCYKDDGMPTAEVPHSTSSTSFDDTMRTTDGLVLESNIGSPLTTAFRDIPRSNSAPPLPPKPQYENVRKVPRRLASADLQNSGDQKSNTLPPQPSAAHARDQSSSHHKSSHMLSQRKLEKKVFLGCSPAIFEKLDIQAILPYLNKEGMLTAKDYQTLINKFTTEVEKIEYIIYMLPRKSDFFGKFIYCLCMSKSGTGHDDIVKDLHKLKAKLVEDNKNNEMGASDQQEADGEDENEPYPIFIDLPDGVRSLKVKSSQTISSLIVQLSSKLNIQNDPLEIQVDDGEKVSHSECTLRDSRIRRHSFIRVCT